MSNRAGDGEKGGGRRLPDLILITCLANGRPLSGAWAKVTVKAAHKNDFGVVAGPADSDATIAVTREEILSWGEQDVNTFPMDYSHPEKDWTGRVLIEVMNSESVDRARRAYDLFGAHLSFPPDYEAGLREYAISLQDIGGQSLTSNVQILPPDSAVLELKEQIA